MGLPLSNTKWPPESMTEPYMKMAEWAAWYSGEPARLIDYYGAVSPPAYRPWSPWYRFWSRARGVALDGSQKALMHVPVASDLAGVSGALLFGEPPRVRIKEAHEDEEIEEQQTPDAIGAQQPVPPLNGQQPQPTRMGGQLPQEKQPSAVGRDVKPGMLPGADPQEMEPLKKKKPETPAQKTEAALLELIEESEVMSRLLEAAETGAGLGGVYIYPAWDKKLRDRPFVAIAQADMAVPTFRYGFLVEVIFHRVVKTDGNRVWRHLEWHHTEGEGEQRKCVVEHAIYRGTEDNLGERVGLRSVEEAGELEPRVELPFGELDVEYIPNIRPNRIWRASGLGVADIQGSESLLDAVDETYASWMRDVRLAKARIIVPTEYLEMTLDDNGNKNPMFDVDQEVFTPMEIPPNLDATATSQIMANQFEIRWQEHEATADNFIRRIVSNAGYAPTTLGEKSATRDGATAAGLRVTEHKTLLTVRRKAAKWRAAVARVLYHLQLIDTEEFDQSYEPIKPIIEMSDAIIDQPLELAQTALAMKTAEASSIETRVRILHPEWTDAEVASEVERIKGEKEPAPSPFGVQGPPQFGDPKKDEAATANFPQTKQPSGPPPKNPPPQNPPPFRR